MKYRWESYVKYHGKDELVKFCREFYGDNPKEKVLFLLGKGFDPRMNNTLSLLLENVKGLQLDCLTFDFPDSGNHAQNRKLYRKPQNPMKQVPASGFWRFDSDLPAMRRKRSERI